MADLYSGGTQLKSLLQSNLM